MRVIHRVPDVARSVLAVLAEEHAAVRGERGRFTGSSATARIEHRLIELAERYGMVDGTRVIVMLPLTPRGPGLLGADVQ